MVQLRIPNLVPTLPGIPALLVLLVASTSASHLQAQAPGTLDGLVREAESGEPIPGAEVILGDGEWVGATTADGRFQISALPQDTYRFRVEALGYRPEEGVVEISAEGARIEVSLARQPLLGSEVVATGTPLRGVAPYQPGQAFDAEELTIRAGNSFGEMLDGEPGLALRSFGPAAGRPVIRGLDGDRVAVLEGGLRMGDMSETAHDHAVAMEPLLAERVEVVRGPASLLYGSSALGGVVNLLRRDIPTEWSRGISGTAATQGATVNRLAAAVASAVYGFEHWAGSAHASLRDGRDFRAPGTPNGVLESTHSRLVTGGAGIGWESGNLRGGGAFDLHDHVYGVPEELDDPDEEVEIRSARRRVSGLVDWRRPGSFIENVDLRVAGARFLQREVERERQDDASIEEEIEHEFERHTVDVTITAAHGPAGIFSGGALGASILASDLTARGAEEFHPDGRSLSVGVFAFEQAPLTEWLSVQAGLRLEHGRTEARENAFFPDFSARREATTVSGAIGLSARPRDGMEVGGQFARAHRTPLLEQLYSEGPHLGAGRFEVGEPALRNELGHGFDLFTRFGGVRAHGEVALFYNRIDDYVFPRRTGEVHEGTGLPVVEWSATEAAFAGGEVAFEALLSSALHVRVTGDYVRAGKRLGDREPLPFIPPARASLTARYDPGSWWIEGRGRLAAEQRRVPTTQEPTDGYALLDLQAGVRLGGDGSHMMTFRIDNLLDTVYRDHLSRVDERRFPMPGRNITAVYHWTF